MHAVRDINVLGVLVATFAISVLGGLWFAFLFAKPYAFALGREDGPQQKPGPLFILGPMACGLVSVITSAWLLKALQVQTLEGAVGFGGLVGLGFLASTTVNTAINPNIPRPLVYGLVSGSYFLLAGVVTSVTLVAVG